MTADEYSADPEAIRPGRPRVARVDRPPGWTGATVHQAREGNRVVRVRSHGVFGTALALVGSTVPTCFVERHNGTDRSRCGRKARTTDGFSKDWQSHRAASRFSHFRYHFCWPVRTLRVRDETGRRRKRTPAMAAGLTDHVWTVEQSGMRWGERGAEAMAQLRAVFRSTRDQWQALWHGNY
jgi:hypothetical protein